MRRPLAPLLATFVALSVSSAARADETEECVKSATEADRLRRDVTALRAASKHLAVCSADACPEVIRNDCRAWLREVDEKIPTIVLVADDGAGGALLDVRASIAGIVVAERLDGKPIALDAGAHTVTFERPGHAPVEVKVVLVAGQKNVEVRAHIPTPRAKDRTPPSPPASPPAPPPEPEPGLSTWQMVGAGVGALGLAGVGLGTVFGVRAIRKHDAASCPDNRCGPGSDPEALRAAGTSADLSTGFFVAGGVLLAGGAALYYLAPKPQRGGLWVSPTAGPRGARLEIGGAF